MTLGPLASKMNRWRREASGGGGGGCGGEHDDDNENENDGVGRLNVYLPLCIIRHPPSLCLVVS